MKSKEASEPATPDTRGSASNDEERSLARTARITQMMSDLRTLGLKLTPQRRAIVEQFACDPSHPTAQELFDRLHREFPTMSFATVYNTLDALTGANLAGTLRLDGHAARFDPNRTPHHHAVCDACGIIVDIPSEALTSSGAATAAALAVREQADGFDVRAVEHVYRGICGACARKARA